MIRVITFIMLIAVAIGAPGNQQLHQYLLLSPQTQLHLQPTLKLQQPLLQPISQLGRIQSPKDQQLFIYYPNTPLLQYPVYEGALKQDNGNWLEQLGNFFFPTQKPPTNDPPAPAADTQTPADATKANNIELQSDAEQIPVQRTPASTQPLPERRIFILNGQPQFFGNFDALANPLNPVYSLQPLQAIKARSVMQSSEEANDAITLKVNPVDEQNVQLQQISPVVDVMPGVPLQLRSGLDLQQQQQSGAGQNQLLSDVDLESEIQQARFQSDYPNILNQAQSPENIENKKEDLTKPLEVTTYESDDPSLARTRPSAVALAGKGGLASASPMGTSLVGRGGIAQSSPQATSVAGDFLKNDEDADKREN